jgi:UDP-N-acetylglucosamine--N-acetylmuramyl-(pentapeptide) pyrophosphoryl-undecaprenol N-acetylglucosamine transferase
VKVIVAGGGTGGHVFPGLALADRLRSDHDATVEFIGSPSGPEARLVPDAGYPFHAVDAAPLYREVSRRAARAPFVALRSVRASRPFLVGADVVVGVGGYVSVPPGLAARRARVPLVLHEQNAVPSLSNRLLARRAVAVGLTFEDARQRMPGKAVMTLTGNPVRASILSVTSRRAELAAEARSTFGFESGRTTVVVFGGSQGALHLDETIAGALPLLSDRDDLQFLILTGADHAKVVAGPAASAAAPRTHVLPFLERMELAYAIADLAVTRSGATSIAEMTACGIPMLLVPYPFATENHQEANAREMERSGAAAVALDAELTPDGLARSILQLVDARDRRNTMAAASRAWGRPDADVALAAVVVGAVS